MSAGPFTQKRQLARELAVQALYEWQLSANDVPDILTNCLSKQSTPLDETYLRALVTDVVTHHETLEAAFSPFLDREISQLDPIARAILWIASYELLHQPSIPYRVVINEALGNAKKYGPTGAHKFINGVLDKLARQNRAIEIKKPAGEH